MSETVSAMVEILQRAVLTIWTGGGQGTARRNAWQAMVVDLQHSRARDEAAESLRAAAIGSEIAGAGPVHAHA
jgi:hypothetical protein